MTRSLRRMLRRRFTRGCRGLKRASTPRDLEFLFSRRRRLDCRVSPATRAGFGQQCEMELPESSFRQPTCKQWRKHCDGCSATNSCERPWGELVVRWSRVISIGSASRETPETSPPMSLELRKTPLVLRNQLPIVRCFRDSQTKIEALPQVQRVSERLGCIDHRCNSACFLQLAACEEELCENDTLWAQGLPRLPRKLGAFRVWRE